MDTRRILRGTLRCTDKCGSTVPIALMESKQGVFKLHQYICAKCLGVMVAEVSNEISKPGAVSKDGP
jgi:hypothetical protein